MLDKTGRQRHYDISPLDGYADRDVAFMAAFLSELRARFTDQFEDLPTDALDFAHPKVGFTIGQLAIHVSWGEVQRLRTFLETPIEPEVEAILSQGALSTLGTSLPPSRSAQELIEIVNNGGAIVDDVLRRATGLDAVRDDDGSTLRGVLMHLQWHWSFHSGHVGLIRLLWGSDYTWTMHPPLAPQP